MKQKIILECINDVLQLRNTDTKMYTNAHDGYFQWHGDTLCWHDPNDKHKWAINTTIPPCCIWIEKNIFFKKGKLND